MENKPQKLILDFSKWRCGEDGPHKVGEGKVALQNQEGFQCCLGQWCLQLGASEEEILKKGEPDEINTFIPLFVTEEIETGQEVVNGDLVSVEYSRHKHSSSLASACIGINDDAGTTAEEKITALSYLLGYHGILLEVINKP